MSDAATWREKARASRDRAEQTSDTEKESVLLTLASDCDELAADLEKMGALEKQAPPKAG
jgi:hypothetical protein